MNDAIYIKEVEERASAYDMPGVGVNDPEPANHAVVDAAEPGCGGRGPGFIECVTSRVRGHYVGAHIESVPKYEVAAAITRDPIPPYRQKLLRAAWSPPRSSTRFASRLATRSGTRRTLSRPRRESTSLNSTTTLSLTWRGSRA